MRRVTVRPQSNNRSERRKEKGILELKEINKDSE